MLFFRCERVHINSSLRKRGVSYKLQPSLLKQEMERDEIFEDTWELENMDGYLMLKMMYYQLLSFMLGIQGKWKK